MALLNFNASSVPESDNNFDPLPAGWYTAVIAGEEIKVSRSGDNYLNLRIDITGPTHAGRVVWDSLHLWNTGAKSAQTIEIAQQTLASICKAIGVPGVNDSAELLGRPLMVKLSVRRSEDYGDSNEVKGYKAAQGAIPAAAQSGQVAAPAQQAAPAADGAPAWMRG